MSFKKQIAVFCGSSAGVKSEYAAAARQLGSLLGQQGRTLVFGGCLDGLMGEVARSAYQSGAAIRAEYVMGLFTDQDHLPGAEETVHNSVRERKHGLLRASDACIMLPGGMGTLDEFTEVCAAKQLGELCCPVGILNIAGYYDSLLSFFQAMRAEGFLSAAWDGLYCVAETPEGLLGLLDARDQ